MSTSDFEHWDPVDDDQGSSTSPSTEPTLLGPTPPENTNEPLERSKMSRSPIRSLQSSKRESVSSIDGAALKSTPADPQLSAVDPVTGVNSPLTSQSGSALSSVNHIIGSTKVPVVPEDVGNASNNSFFNNMLTTLSFKGPSGNSSLPPAQAETPQQTPVIISYRRETPSKKNRRSTSADSSSLASPLQEMEKPDVFIPQEYNKKLYVEECLAKTNYHYATEERNADLHKIFKSIPLDDRLLDDFSCALSREFLFQGRVYVTESNICFNSNLLGWVTHLVISMRDITTMEKTSTAGLFPNGIAIETRMGKHQFVSFISRDSTFDFIKTVWSQFNGTDAAELPVMSRQSSIPSVRDDLKAQAELIATFSTDANFDVPPSRASIISENDAAIEDAILSVDDFTPTITLRNGEKISDSGDGARDNDEDEDDDDYEYEDDEDEDCSNSNDLTSLAIIESETALATQKVYTLKENTGFEYDGPSFFQETKFLYDPSQNNETVLAEEELKAPPGVVYQLIFSGDNTSFLETFLKGQNSSNLSEIPAFDQVNKDGQQYREYSYAKALNYAVGPKSTKCLATDTVLGLDYENCINVVNTTKTPDVPSGNSFCVKTRYMLRWASPTTSFLKISFWVEWTGSSWIKSMIDKSCKAGQIEATDAFIELIREYVGKFTEASQIEIKQQPQKRQPQSRRVSRNSPRLPKSTVVTEEKVITITESPEATKWDLLGRASVTNVLLIINFFLLLVVMIREQSILRQLKKNNAERWPPEKNVSVDQVLSHFKSLLGNAPETFNVDKGVKPPPLREWLEKHGAPEDSYNVDIQKRKQYQRYLRYVVDQWMDGEVSLRETDDLLLKLNKLIDVVNSTRLSAGKSDRVDASKIKDAVDYLIDT
ncbi:LAQU0S06e05424g1_1 [Lachancea quebecensis]|uniref:LAQU0S06e05424g1_1 n=1 Tax=Lachancea quebecensis TaxID=1654605 RepID=A0A0P1KS07_9SACH|nr:LAQU0S06e05424g1_1 [Lachancea quebecensis]